MSDIAVLTDELINSMPESTPVAENYKFPTDEDKNKNTDPDKDLNSNLSISPDAVPEAPRKIVDKPPFLRDEKSNLFDPQIHATTDDGQPVRNKDGSFRKKRGRKSAPNIGKPVISSTGITRTESLAAGKAVTETIFVICSSIFGPEWNPIIDVEKGINEPQSMTDAWAAYFETTGVKTIPPWVGLSVVMASYSLPRLRGPQTKSRMQKFMDLFKGKKNARTNSRNDWKRQNNSSQNISSGTSQTRN